MEERVDHNQQLCPSSPGTPGAILIGIVGPDGRLAYLGNSTVAVDEAWVARAQVGRAPEKRFRFASPCVNGMCAHWQENRCEIADTALTTLPPETAGIPHCGIRNRCLWYAQEGIDACHRCPRVITNVSESDQNALH